MKNLVVALVVTLVTVATPSSLSSAQNVEAVSTLQYASPVVAPGYLGLGNDVGGLIVSFSRAKRAASSPLVEAAEVTEGPHGLDLRALHADTSLTEIVDYYWRALTGLGFTGSVKASTRGKVTYAFVDGERHLEAVFTWQGGDVTADLSWTPVNLVSLTR